MAAVSVMITPFTSCSNDDGPAPDPTPQFKPGISDIVGGRMIHCVNINDIENGGIPVGILNEITITHADDTHIGFHVRTDADGSKYVIPELKQPLESGGSRFIKLKVAMRDNPDVARNVLVLLYNPVEETRSGIEKDYSSYIGKSTQYFGPFGNTVNSVFLYDSINKNDEKEITAITTLNHQGMLEIEGSNYEQTIHTWQAHLGLSAKVPLASRDPEISDKDGSITKRGRKAQTLSGSIDLNVNGMDASSNSYEYYLNFIKVEKAWIQLNTKHFIGDEYTKPSENLPSVINGDLISEFFADTISYSEAKAVNFFKSWGTDVITSGLFGGYAMYVYGRVENTYETSVGFDATISANRTTPGSAEGLEKDWAKIYMKANGGSYQNVNLGAGYQNENYEKASKSVKFSKIIGGANSFEAEKWFDGFNDPKDWSLISYVAQTQDDDDLCALTAIDDVLGGLVDYYEAYVAEACDYPIINAMNNKIVALSEEKVKYIEKNLVEMRAKKKLVLADVMMKKGNNGHKSGDPQPFVAENPRNGDEMEYLIYYPIMANKNAPCDRGYAVETSQDKYYVISDSYDHYWYYALAPEDMVTGIHDIKFEDEEKDGYHFRGDHPDQGGVEVTKNHVCIKYYLDDPTATRKITAFGLYKRDGDSGPFDPDRIIGSTGGSELSLSATTTEINNWENFWSQEGFYNKTQWAEGIISVNTKLWPCMTTTQLPIERISNRTITHPKTW